MYKIYYLIICNYHISALQDLSKCKVFVTIYRLLFLGKVV